MRQVMFNLHAWSPDDKPFTSGMQDTILTNAPSAYLGSLPAILTSYLGTPSGQLEKHKGAAAAG